MFTIDLAPADRRCFYDTKRGGFYLSRIPEFYKLSLEERIREVQAWINLSDEEIDILRGAKGLTPAQADRMSENVVGTCSLPRYSPGRGTG